MHASQAVAGLIIAQAADADGLGGGAFGAPRISRGATARQHEVRKMGGTGVDRDDLDFGIALRHAKDAQGIGHLQLPGTQAKDAPAPADAAEAPHPPLARVGRLHPLCTVSRHVRRVVHPRPDHGKQPCVGKRELLFQLISGYHPGTPKLALRGHPVTQRARPEVAGPRQEREGDQRPAPRPIGADDLQYEQYRQREKGEEGRRLQSSFW